MRRWTVFGSKRREERRSLIQEETERLRAMTDPQLAAEVMSKFGSFDADTEDINVGMLGRAFVPDAPFVKGDVLAALWKVIDEGAQMLLQAGLVNSKGWGGTGDGNVYTVTRKGRTALEQHTVEKALDREKS
jgi:hypothetical protein